ncbi:Ig-like domain-containing protein [Comamonas sp. lk]|uniref:Ig-like domain-containing protein n=1 Tax=Comamonas sp. lk TaxID=2201272 RepID=UPI000EAE6A6B|nr:Ig-like domain-containing protein [Comamonas sp. lk]
MLLSNGNSVNTVTNSLSIAVTYASGTAEVTISSAAGLTAAAANALINGMTYANDSKAPIGTSRSVVLFSVRDNGGGSNTTNVGTTSAVTLVAVNDAPTLSGGPFFLTGTNEDTTSTGTQINTVLAGLNYSDPDSGALLGAAVTATTGNGTWQFSLNGVSGWTAFGTVSNSTALLLTGNTYVRYVPDGANGEAATLTLRAWDRSSGTASSSSVPRTADTTSSGGSTAFSSGTASASLTVTSVNDAPVLTSASPTLLGLTDGQINNPGVLVSSLYSTNYTDVDTGAIKGIAITSLSAGNGSWQYSLDGTTWNNVGVVTVSSALLLRSSDHVRFVPDGVNGTTADFTFRAWDQTGITNGMQGTKANASAAGGNTAFSTGLNTASITVTAVNDAPTLTGSGGGLTWTEGNNTTSLPVVIDSGLTITDADGPYIASATVRISNNYSNGNDYLALVSVSATMGNIIGTWDAGTGTLTLTSAGNQASLAQFQAALQAVTFTNLSDSPTVGTRTVEFKVNDGSLDSLSVSRNILISAVDDAPLINVPTSITVLEDIATVISQISISDPDSSNIFMTLSVTSGTLGALGGAGVTVGGTPTAMTLSGTIANVNAFISNNRVTYTTAANTTADVTLTVGVDTGSVGTDTKTITLSVTPVNDAPVVTVPVSLTVTEDVPGGVTNISFSDVDAGNASVTATFSVPSGVLRAVSGSGVTVDGSGTGTLTLSGSLSDINTFIAATRVSFQTALNSTDSVLLTVSINDNGNTGGAAQTDSKTVIINVSAVNDAPVNSVPGAQTIKQNVVLAFNTLKGNAISFSDPDAGSSNVIVILNSVNGTMSLTAAGGVSFVTGDGVDDTSIRMQGTLADLNTTLQSLTFKPTTGFLGNAQMSIQTNDMGFSGSGGAKTDFDLILITVVPANPAVTSVSAQGLDRTVKIGDEVLVNVVFDQVVNADTSGGIPSLLLETGLLDRNAVYVSGTGSNTLVFKYTVQAGDSSVDLDFQSTAALQMNGAVISNNTSDLAILTLPTIGGANSLGGRSNIVVDGVVPVVASVGMPSDGSYIVGQNLDFTVNFSENVVVSTVGGTPRIAVTLDTGGTVYADYVSGSGSSVLVFRLVVASGQLDSTGVTLGNSVDPNGGSIRDAAGNNSVTALNNIASPANVKVDGVVPTVVSVAVPAGGSYKAGTELLFTMAASEAVQIGGLAPRLVLNVGGATRYATYISGSGSAQLVFKYTVQSGDTDTDGIAVNTLDLRGESLTDLAGNNLNLTLNGLGSTAGVLVDTTAPSASGIVHVDATPTNNGSVSFTVTFSEDVSGVDVNDFALTLTGSAGGTISTVTRVNGTTWTVLVNGLSGLGTLGLNLNGSGTGIVDAADNAVVGGLSGAVYAVDRIAPSITSVDVPANGSYVAGQNLDFTVHLDDVVQLDTTAGSPRLEVTLDNGVTAYATYLSGAGTNALVFRLTVTGGQLDSNGISVGNSMQLNGATMRDAVGNDAITLLKNVASTSGVRVDAVRPTATIVVSDAALKVGETSLVTITFNETVTGLTTADFTVANGTLSGLSSSDGGSTWTATLTPAAGITDTSNLITLDNTGYMDAAGNSGTGTSDSNSYAIDTLRPTAGIVVADSALSVGETSLVTITFNEAVTGLTTADFTVGNGTLSGLSSSDGGKTWTATLTPTVNLENTVNLITLDNTGYADAAGNSGTGTSDSNSYAIDTVRPTATMVVSDAALKVGETSLVTITFNEAVSGLTTADFTVANGALSGLSSSDGGKTWTATLTPTVNLENTANLITLDNTGYADAAGNSGTGTSDSNSYAIDTVRPTATIVVSDAALKVGETSLVTITFNEAVTGLTTADFTVANGALSGLSSSDGGKTWTATLTPTVNLENTANLITLDNTGYADAAGNSGTGTSDSNSYAIDTVRPTATMVVSDAALKVGETSLVTITFNEAVTGLTTADFTVANGALSGLSSSDGGKTWTATLTPTVNLENTVNLITLDNTGYADAAGNSGTGTSDSNSYAIDTVRPTATMVVSDAALKVGETSLVTITFNEAVTGLTTADFTVANGALSGLSSSDGGKIWTATLTPTVNLENTANLITLDNTGYADAAGNSGTGTSDSNSYAIDTVRPTATIVVSDAALKVGETSLVTITFNEAVSGLTTADFTVANGALSGLSSSDGGKIWTATLTPTVNLENTANLITLDNTGYMDAAGNTGTGTSDSNSYAIDTLRPTATIVVSDAALKVGETSLVTITFSEAVTGFTNADLTIANGTLSAVSSSDGGSTWTATLTPTVGITDTSNLITLDNTGYADATGNTGTGTTDSGNYAIDTLRPTATIVVSDAALKVGETSLVTITFNEVVTGLTTADFTVANGVLSGLSSSDGGKIWTATLTPTVNLENTANLITLDNTGYMDAAGNTGTGTSDSNSYAIDTLRPTAGIVVADSALSVGETSLVTITFNEAVTGLTTADFTVANGVLSGLSSSDGGKTWTATLTPVADVEHTDNLITLNNAGVKDAAGNTGTGSTDSNVYAVETLAPAVPELSLDQFTLVNGQQISPTGVVFVSGVEAGARWQYSLDNGVSWNVGQGGALQLSGLGAHRLLVQQIDTAGNTSREALLNFVVEPLLPPAVLPQTALAASDSGMPMTQGIAANLFQPSEVAEPSIDFLHSAPTLLHPTSSAQNSGISGAESGAGYGLTALQAVTGFGDWMGSPLPASGEAIRSGLDGTPELLSALAGTGSSLNLKALLIAPESSFDTSSLQFSLSGQQALPGWIQLDRNTGQLLINAPKDMNATLVLHIKVSDGQGRESVQTFKLVIGTARTSSVVLPGRAGLSEKMANAAKHQAGHRMPMYSRG